MKKKMKKRAVKILAVSICMLLLLVTMAVPCFASESIPGIDLPSGYTKDNPLYVFRVFGDSLLPGLSDGDLFWGTSFEYQFTLRVTDVPQECDCGCGIGVDTDYGGYYEDDLLKFDVDVSDDDYYSSNRAFVEDGGACFNIEQKSHKGYKFGSYPENGEEYQHFQVKIWDNEPGFSTYVRFREIHLGSDDTYHCYTYYGVLECCGSNDEYLIVNAWSGADMNINGGACKEMCREGLFTIDASNYVSEYDSGYRKGVGDGYDTGHSDGYDEGYSSGYGDCFKESKLEFYHCYALHEGIDISGIDPEWILNGSWEDLTNGALDQQKMNAYRAYLRYKGDPLADGLLPQETEEGIRAMPWGELTEGMLSDVENIGYEEGVDIGFGQGETEALNQKDTFKSMVFAIFEAPVTLINGMLDFNLFGINLLSFTKTLLTLAVVGVILAVILKNKA